MTSERLKLATEAAADVAKEIHKMLCTTDWHHRLCYEAWEVVELLGEPQAPLVLAPKKVKESCACGCGLPEGYHN